MPPDRRSPPPSQPEPSPPAKTTRGAGALGRLAGFRSTYLAIFLFAVAYVFSIEALEGILRDRFDARVRAATQVDPTQGEVASRIQSRVRSVVSGSPWVRIGDVRVHAIVLGADGRTLLFAGGSSLPMPAGKELDEAHLLPPLVDVNVTVPHNALVANAILVGYAAVLLSVLYGISRRADQREAQRLQEVLDARDALVQRSRSIEGELTQVRQRLQQVEPEKEIYAEEIHDLEQERASLLARLAEVEQREEALRQRSRTSRDLEDERRSLEELLEEAARELEQKNEEIRRLSHQAKRGARLGARAARDEESLARRLRTLYKNLEISDGALSGLAKIGDESLKLRAEEALKRLSDEPDTAAVRRKVGGLPPHLSIFELGFAGRGRIYYSKGTTRRFRVLLIGTKSSQKTDLEYLSRLPKESG